MRIVVDSGLCSGHARCNATADDLFPLDDLGYVAVTDPEVPAGQEKRARDAVGACPERALSLIDG
jgi:ferredoxin